jgi:hypothetical protein
MSKRLMSMGVLVGFLVCLMMATGAFAAAAGPKDTVVFNVAQGKVTFNHKAHVDKVKIECTKCHHTWKAGETSGKVCKDCHKEKAEGKTLAVKDAFHKDCQGCHSDLKKANKATGPTVCTQCHVKAAKK